MRKNLERKPGCIQAALDIIGDKWTALLLREMYQSPRRFNQLQNALPGISPRTLSQRLSKLEECEVVKKQTGESVGYAEYALTKKGYDFTGILEQMAAWGEKYHELSKI